MQMVKDSYNKERKVRAWDKAYKTMDYNFFVSALGQAYERPRCPGNSDYVEIEQTKNLVIMDCVGTDDFDTTIFEMDIVSYFDKLEKKNKYAKVIYDKKTYGYYPMCRGNFKNLRVVGNVYENEELESLM